LSALLSSLPAVVAVLVMVGLVAYGGYRVGVRFLIQRLAGLVFVLFGITFITFILGYVSPGSPVQTLCGSKCTLDLVRRLEHKFSLDLPWYTQYGHYINNLLHFDLGLSYSPGGQTVWQILQRGVPISIELGVLALLVQLLIGIPFGVIAATRAGSRFDTSAMSFALICFALPTFIVIPFFQLFDTLLATNGIHVLPVSGWGTWQQIIAPVGLLAFVGFGYYARLTRTTMLDTLSQDYVRTARAKGLRERVVTFRHAFRNALVPLVTAIGPALAFVVGGAFFTETLFNIPGIGNIAVNSIQQKDMPVVQGTVIIVAVAVAIMNLFVDVVYGLLDPRIKVS
jgi:ABC-type dipeptide/oligopeptide/nickel transport system permease component